MLIDVNKPMMLSVVMLNVVMLSVVAPDPSIQTAAGASCPFVYGHFIDRHLIDSFCR